MNNFDPFYSTEYKRNLKDEFQMEAQPQLIKKSDSEFIQQLLSTSFSFNHKQILENTQVNVIHEKQSELMRIQENSDHSVESKNSKKSQSKNSLFHNFQKHLVITLRQILTMKGIQIKGNSEHELALKIFEFFKGSHKTSRQFLEQVFGLYQAKDSNNKSKIEEIIRKGQLKQVFINYESETILKAQQILKHYTKLQLDQSQISQCIKHRKIQKKAQFIAYIDMFKTQLVNGKQRKKTYKLLAKKLLKNQNETKQQCQQDKDDSSFDISD